MVGVAILLIAVGVVVVVVSRSGGNPSPAAASTSGPGAQETAGDSPDDLVHDRPGFNRADLDPTIGDPAALTMQTDGSPRQLSDGTPVYPACGVLTMADLADLDLRLYPNNYGYPVQQSYLDNKGIGSFAPDLNQFPASDETSSCAYGIDGKDTAETVAVSVYQPFVVDSAVIDFQIEALEYTPDPSIASQGGYEVFSRSEAGDVGYLLRGPDATMVLDVGIPDAAEIGPKLVHAVLDNIEELKANPQGAYVPSYDSPTFTGTYPRACDLMDNDDVKVLTGLDSSPLVNELIPTATGILDLSDVDSAAPSHAPDLSGAPEKSNYVRSSCTRRAVDPEYGVLARPSDHTITVTTTTYESPEAASAGLLYLAAGIDNESKQKGHGVGEEAFLYVDRDGQIVLAVRQGRVVAELLYDFAQQVDTPDAMAAKLSPLATKGRDRIGGLLNTVRRTPSAGSGLPR